VVSDCGSTAHCSVGAPSDISGRDRDVGRQFPLNVERELLDIGALCIAIEDGQADAEAGCIAVGRAHRFYQAAWERIGELDQRRVESVTARVWRSGSGRALGGVGSAEGKRRDRKSVVEGKSEGEERRGMIRENWRGRCQEAQI